MNFKRLIPFALFCACLSAQTKTPLDSPHWNFFDGGGAPCAGCTLSSYLAGTTTPTPTYTDASGLFVNTNPIILDAAGGAQIWVGNITFKLVLKDTLGATVWTADNIPPSGSGSGGPCGPATTIQIANSTVTGFDCDALITIDNVAHTINVGGPLPSPNFTLTNIDPVTSSWVFDVTNPVSAALSLGGGTKGPGKYIDGSTGNWTTLPSVAGGTVSSVAVTVPTGLMTVTGTPITTSGTIALALNPTGTGTKEVTATAAGTSGQYACWTGAGDVGSSSTPCVATADQYFNFTGCLVGGSTDNQCSGSFNLPIAEPDSSYQVFLQTNALGGSQNLLITLNQSSLPSTPSVAINYVLTCTFSCGSTVSPTIYVHAHHN